MLKKLIVPVVLGGTVLGALTLSGVAGAATSTPTAASTPATKGQAKGWLQSHRKEIRKAGLDLSAKTIGITPRALASDLKAGNSIAGVASQHNVNPQTVVTALVNAVDGRINQAVTAGKLTSAQASKIEAKVPGRVTKVVNHTF